MARKVYELLPKGLEHNGAKDKHTEGSFEVLHNLSNEDGAIKPILPPRSIASLQRHDEILIVHSTAKYKHFIIKNGTQLFFSKDYDLTSRIPIECNRIGTLDIKSVQAIGNTLVVLDNEGIKYLLWKDGKYQELTELPDLNLVFSLDGGKTKFRYAPGVYKENDPDPQMEETTSVLGGCNRLIAEAHKDGRFVFPFLVRYALRLFDGSLVKHGPPVLMTPSTYPAVPDLIRVSGKDKKSGKDAYIVLGSRLTDYGLQYKSLDSSTTFSKWGDIVKSVEIYVSAPIYNYDQSADKHAMTKRMQAAVYSGSGLYNDYYDIIKDFPDAWCPISSLPLNEQKEIDDWAASDPDVKKLTILFSTTGLDYQIGSGPSRPISRVVEEVKTEGRFYLLKSIPIDQIKTSTTTIETTGIDLSAIVTRPLMVDDYDSHDQLIPEKAFVYNGRLNIANVKKKLFGGFSDLSVHGISSGGSSPASSSLLYKNGNDLRRMTLKGGGLPDSGYFYFPLPSASSVVSGNKIMQLEPHATLNGAVSFNGFKHEGTVVGYNYGQNVPVEKDSYVDMPSKIYTSAVGNPFYFPLGGINTVGTGEILGMASATKAISLGQYGQFPLYVFSTEGVWAMSVAGDGSFSARHPLTRDVCTNPSSITPIDDAVVFTTDRGLMLLSGSEVMRISTAIENDLRGQKPDSIGGGTGFFPDGKLAVENLRNYLKKAYVYYVYSKQRLIVSNPEHDYAYVYSLSNQSWSTMTNLFGKPVPDYPNMYAISRNDNKLYNLGLDDEDALVDIQFVTNTFAPSYPYRSTIYKVVLKGYFSDGVLDGCLALQGQRSDRRMALLNRVKGHYMSGRGGSGYPRHCISGFGNMRGYDEIDSILCEYVPKQTNKIR